MHFLSIRSIRPFSVARVGLAAAAVALVAGCSSGTEGTGSTPGSGTSESPGEEVAMEHIHGLGVDPSDGMLYAGTHYGLFRVPADGAPTRVAGLVQDFMGFTVVGPQHFVASGHPGHGQDGPSAVGLIASTDAGETWDTLSLAGEADFHSLEAVGGTIYGLNAMTGAFMVSNDGRAWETRSSVRIADFAVNPSDTAVVLATSEQGPARSSDGGKTFSLLSDAPLLVLVDWAEDGTLVGVAPDGVVHVSADGGEAWEARGTLAGPPEAMHVEDAQTVYAAASGTVWASADGGRNFTERPATQ